jgi:methyl-accepting chemotaxis protein
MATLKVAVVILAIAGLIFLILTVLSTLKEIENLRKISEDLSSGEADLTKRIEIKKHDEIGEVAKNINSFIQKVQNTIQEAKETSAENASISEELSRTSLGIGKKVENESVIIEKVTINSDKIERNMQEAIEFAIETKR